MMLLSLYKTVLQVATPLLEKHLRKREKAGKEDIVRRHERLGRPVRPRGEKKLVWCHAASVGEAVSLLSVVTRLLKDDSSMQVMVTTGTVTSAALMADRLPEGAFHQYIPVDHPAWVEGFLDHWRPDFVVWSESELWPNILQSVRRRNIPAVLLNARMSESTFQKWKWVRGSVKKVLSTFDICFAQNKAEAARLKSLGARVVKVSGNLKYAAAPLPFDEGKLDALRNACEGRSLLLWASTHAGEEEIACRIHAALKKQVPDLLTIIVPRHPERGKNIQSICVNHGLNVSVRSAGVMPMSEDDVYLADTLGEMGLFYRLARLTVVAGSFANVGGHNPIEAGQLDSIIFYGPVVHNFLGICHDFESRHGALRMRDEDDLQINIAAYFAHPEQFDNMALAAQKWTDEKSYIIDDLMQDIAPYLSLTEKAIS